MSHSALVALCSADSGQLANLNDAAYTPHPCSSSGQTRCSGTDCGNGDGQRYSGLCDKDGCDFNSYRMGNTCEFVNETSHLTSTHYIRQRSWGQTRSWTLPNLSLLSPSSCGSEPCQLGPELTCIHAAATRSPRSSASTCRTVGTSVRGA